MDKKSKPDDDALELKRDVSTERIGRDVAETRQVKKIVKREYELNGLLVNETIVEFAQLSCGHISSAVGAILCICGRSICSSCFQAEGAICSICAKAVGPCCKRVSIVDPDRVYCTRCRGFGFLNWILRG